MSAQPADPNVPPDHVSIEINGVSMTAPKGSMIIQAADRAGIPIPRFCYHDKLPIAANCRMCLVEVEMGGRPMPKPQPACATPVGDGMKIQTRSDRALHAQRNVMEFLLINHPLDCPICDQGGECELQDVSLGYGRSVSRFAERKRVVADEDMGPLVATEMTRCIQCTRCIRVMSEVAGTYELGGMNRGERLEIGTYDGKPLTSELSGNVIDVCPVGALTNKVYRFRARPWELIARESIGYHDALGSNLFLHARRGEIVRTVPRDNDAINECWLSDRDRYSHQGLYAEDRALKPMLREGDGWREADWDEALAAAAKILRDNAGDGLGVLAHPATSNEEGALLKALAEGLGSGHVDHRINLLDFADRPVAEAAQVPALELEQADVVLVVGSNPRHEVPLLHHRLRKAAKRGARIAAINPVDFDFTFPAFESRTVAPSTLPAELEALAAGDAIHDALAKAGSAVILLGAIAETHPQASRIRAAARALAAATGARLNRIPQGANALGLARHGVLPTGLDARAMLAQPRGAYVLYGIEPGLDFADNAAARQALSGARVVAFSHFACASTRAVADVILPIALTPETDATYTNLDGVDQRVVPGGKPPGSARAGWRVLRALGGDLGAAGFGFTDLAGLRAQLAPTDVRCGEGRAEAAPAAGEGALERVATPAVYRADAVLRRAAALQAHPLTAGARAVLHPEEALARGLSEGGVARFADERGTATLPVATSTRVARGAVWIETGYAETAPLSPTAALTVTRA
ncbi:NADH-quinone oxidoreductase subunit NuoG [Coralloluteibacterium stylophorae]|uniref:NADH-quinone oxidoreductase subunit G n=1 Tax=Coralloluteibacterium stylophorae TaxID=1776034 RepID=A0AAP2CC05_9GAMM|nr:NADH-quinone oxidoreductase subunit NuoG [Coralloluteibacterium stylophorae]MBS7457594.1 NADH-quinone oxidoreductase subunit G [Coralloluteibacterium stylophorae]